MSNPDFEHLKPLPAIADQIQRLVIAHGGNADLAHDVNEIVAELDANNKGLEDYLNRNVLRRAYDIRTSGDGTASSNTDWVDVGPETQLQVPKTNPRSAFSVHVDVWGEATGTVGDFIDFGVHVAGGPFGVQYLVTRGLVITSGAPLLISGGNRVAIGAPARPLTVRLQVRCGPSVTWASIGDGSITLSVTETPVP